MGCDIHAHVEVQLADGQWHHWTAPFIERDYSLFAKMAGVRNYDDDVPIAEPRGLPEDIAAATRMARDYEGPDGHSDSWLSLAEIQQLEAWWNERLKGRSFLHREVFELAVMGNYLQGNGYEELPSSVKDVRLVFWFDN